MNIHGQLVFSKAIKLERDRMFIMLDDIPNGTYIVEISDDERRIFKKIIVDR